MSHLRISSLWRPIIVLEKPEVALRQIWTVKILTDLGNEMFCKIQKKKKKKTPQESYRMGRRIDADSLICSLGCCLCNGHEVQTLSQRRLTANLLTPRESDCSHTRSKVSSDWLPSYIKTKRPVLEIFKLAEYFPDRPRIFRATRRLNIMSNISCHFS